MASLGAVRQRARLGDGARGLQRQRRCVELPTPRSRSVASLPMERGQSRRRLRRPPVALPRVRLLERRRPDPQGAHLRPHRTPGQPRGGRQGVLVVRRLDAHPLVDALALSLSASRVSVSDADRRERPPDDVGSRVRARRHRGARRRVLGHHRRLRQGNPGRPRDRAARAQRGRGPSDPARAPDALVPQHLGLGHRRHHAHAFCRQWQDHRRPRGARPALSGG